MFTIMSIVFVLLSVFLVQAAACAIIHIINETKKFPESINEAFLYQFNLIWVLYNLKEIRE